MFDYLISSFDYIYWVILQLIPFWWIFIIILFFLYLIKKYSDNDIFWLRIETWDFWGWKTYNNTIETKKFSNKWLFTISNIRNDFIDLKFDSKLDLERIFSYLMEYSRITNNKQFINNWFRPIVFNIDEAHNYFFSRWFQDNIDSNNIMVLTQVRKRNILATFITQELAQLDIFLRRLTTWIVKRYYQGLWFIRFYKIFYLPNPETTNLNEDSDEWVRLIKKGIYFAPTFLLYFSKLRKEMLNEKYVSKIIVWYTDLLNDLSFMDFLLKLYPINTTFWKDFWVIYKNIYWDKQFHTDFQNDEFVKSERKELDKLWREIQYNKKKDSISKYKLKSNEYV